MASTEVSRIVVVAGDVNIDWNLARSERSAEPLAAWTAETSTVAAWQRGGAALLTDLVRELLARPPLAGWALREMSVPAGPFYPSDPRYHHAYTLWRHVDARGEKAWRVKEFLGLDRSHDRSPAANDWLKVADDPPDAGLVLLDDTALGYREQPELWPAAITSEGRHPWVVLKTAQPVADGKLWQHLIDRHADRLIVVTTAGDLRRTSVQISREISWERTAQDVVRELVHNPRVAGMSRCRATVISFGAAGAVMLARQEAPAGGGEVAARQNSPIAARLFFDPPVIEGAWEQMYPGNMLGYTTCLAGGIAMQILQDPARPDLDAGVQAGLAALRLLHRQGYVPQPGATEQVRLGFPIQPVADELMAHKAGFAGVPVQDPTHGLPAGAPGWSILHDQCCGGLDRLASDIVTLGSEAALHDVPLGQFGDLLTVDRQEIESFRSVRALISEYCDQERPPRPLCIAVFGAPGSGKSFGIWQVARSVRPDQVQKLEFNLSQFTSPDDLLSALHQVRDVGLSGKIPLAFWDEFDATFQGAPWGWLRYFLAPMQDGKFQEGQLTHPIGRAIFVFAGGTCSSMDEFAGGSGAGDFRKAKGPDFVSRLKGYVNIMGPNRRKAVSLLVAEADPCFVVRRAILLRSILERNAPQIFKGGLRSRVARIDEGVLRAFLNVRQYKHGVRSMEAIVAMSALVNKVQFERSSLPSKEQLGLHTNGAEFLARMRQADLTDGDVEALAPMYHDAFRQNRADDGWTHGAQRDEAGKRHPLLVPFGALPPEAMQVNRDAVRAIPGVLAIAGYVLVRGDHGEPDFEFPADDLNGLAEHLHELWMEEKAAAGYRPGKPTPEDPRRSEDMAPWEELAEPVRQIDLDLVRAMPRIVAAAGYRVVKVD